MTKLAALTLVLLAIGLCAARAAPVDGKPMPLFPKLTQSQSGQAALSNGLKTYINADTKIEIVGLQTITIDGIDFTAQAVFGKQDIDSRKTGLDTILLQHKGYVPTGRYYKFLHAITSAFLYAGKGSAVETSAVFYNAVKGDSHLVLTSADRSDISLSVAFAPGKSK